MPSKLETRIQGTAANVAIITALGLNPNSIRKGATLHFTPDGPELHVTHILRDANGKPYAIDDELVTVFKRYRLVPIGDGE